MEGVSVPNKYYQDQYRKYLASDDWKKKRRAKFARSKRRCAVCGSAKRLELHHLAYRSLTNVRMSDLRVLCRRCHEDAHELRRSGVFSYRPQMSHNERFQVMREAIIAHRSGRTSEPLYEGEPPDYAPPWWRPR